MADRSLRQQDTGEEVTDAFTDSTQRKLLEAERRALDAAKTRFIADAAHELRTPLTTLAGFLDLVAKRRHEMSEDQLDEVFSTLSRTMDRVNGLVASLLDLSRAGAEGSLDLRPVEVAEAVVRALEMAPPPVGRSIEVRVPRGTGVQADPTRLEQVLVNLLTNAYRYGGPEITIEAARDGQVVSIEVADDGDGVPEHLVPDLFEPFTKGSKGAAGPGSGLGLAIVRRIVEAFGGELAYRANRPQGARFTLRLRA